MTIPFVHQLHLDQDWLYHQIDDLEKRVTAMQGRAFRHTIIVEFLGALNAAELVASLWVIHQRAFDGQSKSREVLQEVALGAGALAQLPYGILTEAYALADDLELQGIKSLFVPKRPQNLRVDQAAENEYYDIPLGLRRQAARTQDRNVLDRLLHDQNARVIALLLDNPRITERDVVQMAAKRPTRPEILELIAKHHRWSTQYRIRKAIACNPDCSYSLARPLLETLLKQDLQELISMGVLSGQLRADAQKLCQKYKGDIDIFDDKESAWKELADLCAEFEKDVDPELLIMEVDSDEEECEEWLNGMTTGLMEGTLKLVPVEMDEDSSEP